MSVEPLDDPHHSRAGMILVQQAIKGGWKIPEILFAQLPLQVTNLLVSARNDRERLRAAEVLLAMNRDNTQTLAIADKMQRLDMGQATDRIDCINSISDAQLSAAADIISKRNQPDKDPHCPTPKPPRRKK